MYFLYSSSATSLKYFGNDRTYSHLLSDSEAITFHLNFFLLYVCTYVPRYNMSDLGVFLQNLCEEILEDYVRHNKIANNKNATKLKEN